MPFFLVRVVVGVLLKSESESESEGEGESEPYVREVMHCATVEDEKKPTVQK